MKLTAELEKYFGYKEFLAGQEEVIQSIIDKQNTLVVMPTGGGKSLCYQLPALLMDGVAIVISPLIALMKDQYDSLVKINYPATFINSSLTTEEYMGRMIAAKNEQYKLIYIAPERLNSDYFLRLLRELKISFLAVDEAHCISEWGHDFRPAYLNIAKALAHINISHIVALTATATPDVQEDIVLALNMDRANLLVKGFDRPNLSYYTEYLNNKPERVLDIIDKTTNGSTIVYAPSRKSTEEVFNYLNNYLNKNKITVTFYHAGLNAKERKVNQDRFINDECKIIVATNAFGMGIDKPDVRNVIHIGLTSSVEAYYQEAGRAGRDGLKANCYLLWNYADKKIQDWFIDNTFPTVEEFLKIYDYIYSFKVDNFLYSKEQFSRVLDISDGKISYALKQLNMLGILERIANQQNPRIRFCYSKDDLIEFCSSVNNTAKPVLDTLIRIFIELPRDYFADIDIEFITQKYLISLDNFMKGINVLVKQNIIEFQSLIPANTIRIAKPKVEFNELEIDFNKNEKLKTLAHKKLEQVVGYASSPKCKRNYILDYFADKSYNGKCERCSSCLGFNTIDTNLRDNILYAALELNGRFGRTTIAAYLKGSKNEMQEKYDLQKGKYFGKLKKKSNVEIMLEIDKYIELKYLEKSKGEYPVISITTGGKALLKKEIKLLFSTKKEYSSKSYPVKEYDLNKPQKEESQEPVKLKKNKTIIIKNSLKTQQMPTPANSTEFADLIYKIENMFKSGDSIANIADKLGTNNGKIAELIQTAIENGFVTNYRYYTNDETYNEVKKIIEKKNVYFLHDIQSKMDTPINFALLRIVVAFVRKALKGE